MINFRDFLTKKIDFLMKLFSQKKKPPRICYKIFLLQNIFHKMTRTCHQKIKIKSLVTPPFFNQCIALWSCVWCSRLMERCHEKQANHVCVLCVCICVWGFLLPKNQSFRCERFSRFLNSLERQEENIAKFLQNTWWWSHIAHIIVATFVSVHVFWILHYDAKLMSFTL